MHKTGTEITKNNYLFTIYTNYKEKRYDSKKPDGQLQILFY